MVNWACSYSIKSLLKIARQSLFNMLTNYIAFWSLLGSCVEYVYEFKKLRWTCLRIQEVTLNMSTNSRSYVEYVYEFKI